MPTCTSPRPTDTESHHGVMSAWMRAIFKSKYSRNDAPTVLLPAEDHAITKGVYNRWRGVMANQQNVSYQQMDWRKISETQIRQLSNDMFQAANVPDIVRERYWQQFDTYLGKLQDTK